MGEPAPGATNVQRTAAPPENEHARGLILAITGILVLSPDTLIIRLIEVDRPTLLWWRGIFMFSGLALYYCFRHRGGTVDALRAIPRFGWLSAPLFSMSTILFVTSVTMTTVANTLVIVSSAPLFAAIFSRLVLKERVPTTTWVCIGIGVGAIALIFAGNHGGDGGVVIPGDAAGWEGALLGDLCAIGAAIMLAAHFVNARRARAVSLMPPLALSGLLVALVVTPFASPFSASVAEIGKLLILGLFLVPLAFGMLSEAPRYMPAAEVSLIVLLETALGPFWVWLVLGEVPDRWTLIGGAILVSTLVAHGLMGLRGSRHSPAAG
jgi:drug/metabolite transporter (DMT)-like permease